MSKRIFKKISVLFVLTAFISLSTLGAYASQICEIKKESTSAVWLDFTSDVKCQSYIDGASYDQGASLSVRSKAMGGFGLFAEFNSMSEPVIKFDTKIDSDKYTYAKIAFAYSSCKNTDTGNKGNLTSYIRLGSGEKNTVATLTSNGSSLTDCNGSSYTSSNYITSVRSTKIISVVVPLDNQGLSGMCDLSFCPASTSDDSLLNCGVLLKYIAFFESKADADKFDISVSKVVFSSDGGVENFVAEIDPIERVADVYLPELYIRSGELSEDMLTITYADNLSKCTSSEVDSGAFTASYDVKSFDGIERTWNINVHCEQIDDKNVGAMVDDFNSMTQETASKSITKWEWILKETCGGYAMLTDDSKETFVNDMLSLKGEFTKDNYIDIVNREAFFALVKIAETIDEIKDAAIEAGYEESSIYDIFFNKMGEDEEKVIIDEVIKSDNYNEFKENLIVSIYKNSVSYGNVKSLVEGNLEYFGYDDDSYKKLCAKTDNLEKAYKNIVGLSSVDKSSDIIKALERSVKEVGISQDDGRPENVSKNGGNGGSGGSGKSTKISMSGGSTQAIDIPVAVPPQTQQEVVINGFTDLDSVSWAKDSIMMLYDKKIVNGKSNGIFAPNDNVTREEFVKMMVTALNIDAEESNISFDDVDKTKWYAPYIAKAVSAGIITGKSEKSFGIGENITRQDMAVIANRALKFMFDLHGDENIDLSYDDASEISDYAKSSVSLLSELKVISGYNGKFAPLEFTTRAQSSVVIAKIISLVDSLMAGGNN